MLRCSSLLVAAALFLTPVSAGLLIGRSLISATPHAGGPASHLILAQYNPCPNGRCRR